MSREQRRANREPNIGRGPSAPRTIRDLPIAPLAILAGVALIIALIGYLIVQSSSSPEEASEVPEAALDDSPDIAGTYAPFLGVDHLQQQLDASYTPIVPFCDGVESSGIREAALASGTPAAPNGTAAADATPTIEATPTTEATPTAAGTSDPGATATPDNSCYNSNPPSSGRHFGVQRNREIAPGAFTSIPPEPDVYPRDIDMPREAAAHVAEHAGVFVGYNCEDGDQACLDVVEDVEGVVNNRIDNHDDRVTMMYFSDLPEGQIGLSSITRWDRFDYAEYDEDRVEEFISDNACRYDTEGFC